MTIYFNIFFIIRSLCDRALPAFFFKRDCADRAVVGNFDFHKDIPVLPHMDGGVRLWQILLAENLTHFFYAVANLERQEVGVVLAVSVAERAEQKPTVSVLRLVVGL